MQALGTVLFDISNLPFTIFWPLNFVHLLLMLPTADWLNIISTSFFLFRSEGLFVLLLSPKHYFLTFVA